jgi:hypothetical protein
MCDVPDRKPSIVIPEWEIVNTEHATSDDSGETTSSNFCRGTYLV